MNKIKNFEQYNESVNEKLSALQEEYREYFKCILDCYGVKSPAKLSEEKKKEFFDMLGKYSMDKHFSHAENQEKIQY